MEDQVAFLTVGAFCIQTIAAFLFELCYKLVKQGRGASLREAFRSLTEVCAISFISRQCLRGILWQQV